MTDMPPGASPMPPQFPQVAQPSGSPIVNFFKSAAGRIIGIVIIVAVLAGIGLAYKTIVNPDKLGQVVFTTDQQTAGSTESTDACKVNNTVTTIKAGTSFWAVFIWTGRLSDTDAVHEEDFKDGTSIFTQDLDMTKTGGTDCVSIIDDLSKEWTDPGVYEIKLTVGDKVVADGKLTITAQ